MNKLTTAWFNPKTGEIHTPRVRMIYPSLLEPSRPMDNETAEEKYSVTLLIPAKSNIDVLREHVDALRTKQFGAKYEQKHPVFLDTAKFKSMTDLVEDYPTHIRASATLKYPPLLFNPDTSPFKGDASEVYGGRWCVATLRPYAYNAKQNKGVALGLQRVQLLQHDDRIGGGRVYSSDGLDSVDIAGVTTTDDLFGDVA
jgi:Enterobacter phage Enc34, ssDNA-binding protein